MTALSTLAPSRIERRVLSNGLTLVWQPMPWLRTAAYTLWLPGGYVAEYPLSSQASTESPAESPADPEQDERAGLASLVCEMIQRGAGGYSSRQLVAAEDNLGIDASGSASISTASFSASMPAESLPEAIGLLADVVRRPHLPADQLEDAKLMLRQEMLACRDEPVQRLMRRLRERQYGRRLGRSGLATPASLAALSIDDVRDFYTNQYHAGGSILAVAGRFDEDALPDQIEQALGDWKGGRWPGQPDAAPEDGAEHLEIATSQTHIGFAFDSIPYGHPDYFVMRAGIGILSDGMSSRLFDRVREQRGLCYSVWASTHSLPCVGSVFGYAGTTPPRAQETLDVTLHEIQHLADDVRTEELERWKTRIQSSLIMEQESAGSRAGSLAADQFQIGEVLPTERLEEMIESITLQQVVDYWREHAPQRFRVVTAGPESLRTESATEPTQGESRR